MGPALAVEGAITAAVFEVYIGEVLAPKLRPGQLWLRKTSRPTRASAFTSSSKLGLRATVPAPSYSPD